MCWLEWNPVQARRILITHSSPGNRLQTAKRIHMQAVTEVTRPGEFVKICSSLSIAILSILLLSFLLHQPLQAQVTQNITYQGQLTDNQGQPHNGTVPMRFRVYTAATGGTLLYDSDNLSVTVSGGLFNVSLPVPQSLYQGRALWLLIDVAGQSLIPRQEITPAPYALSLRPGARIRQVATGTAVRVESTQGVGLRSQGRVYGVYGITDGADPGAGYGGYFESDTGIGVHGRSTASSTTQNTFAPGVHGWSQFGVGILGQSDATFGAGVLGQIATGTAVLGSAAGGQGVFGSSPAFGVRGIGNAPVQGQGYGGYFTSTTGIGVEGRSTAQPSGTNQFAPGVVGFSQQGVGVLGEAGTGGGAVGGYFRQGPGAGSWAAIFAGRVLVTGDMTVSGTKTGYVADIAINDDHLSLESGDLVIVTGYGEAVIGEIPLIRVRRADAMDSRAIIGVVEKAFTKPAFDSDAGAELHASSPDDAGIIEPGGLLQVVTLGAFRAIKVDADYGPIRPGDLLVSSDNPGHARRNDYPAVGTVIGKALGGLDSGTGTIPVMVSLQ
jgi:hypothetical protein